MNSTKINIKNLVKGKMTYPNWTTNSTYPLQVIENEGNVTVYYKIKGNRIINRIFPSTLYLTPHLSYVLGLIKGEGSTSLNKSNYRRFTLTNSNPKIINIILNEMDKNNLFKKSNINNNSIHLLHYTEIEEAVVQYWSNALNLPKIKFKCFDDKLKTSEYGVCHVYISDVLLRRVIDIIHDEFLNT